MNEVFLGFDDFTQKKINTHFVKQVESVISVLQVILSKHQCNECLILEIFSFSLTDGSFSDDFFFQN